MSLRKSAFTLIELLIVVAIIAILAAIAVPNLLEAQVRGKVSRVKSDMRSYATALESYAVDNGEYPPVLEYIPPPTGPDVLVHTPLEWNLTRLSTPIAYLSNGLFVEPFNSRQGWIMYQGWNVVDDGTPPPDVRATAPTLYAYVAFSNSVEEHREFIRPILRVYALSYGLDFELEEADEILNKRWWVFSPGPDTFFRFDQLIAQSGDALSSLVAQLAAISLTRFNGAYDPTNGTVSVGDLVRTSAGIFGERR